MAVSIFVSPFRKSSETVGTRGLNTAETSSGTSVRIRTSARTSSSLRLQLLKARALCRFESPHASIGLR